MSEEILKALLQLFAIISKQDDGVTTSERYFVESFLKQQLSADLVSDYLKLYNEFLNLGNENADEEGKKKKLTSVKDSVKTLAICRKINKTLTQKQKIIVLIRLLELINVDESNVSEQRLQIIDTVSTTFNIATEEYKEIEIFVRNADLQTIESPHLLVIGENHIKYEQTKSIHQHMEGFVTILQIKSVDMYFLKYNGRSEIQLNGFGINSGNVYLFAYGSAIKLTNGTLYYSDIISHFLTDLKFDQISFNVKNLEYKFPNGKLGLRDVSISEGPGKLIAIMGGSGAGKTTLLNVLAGLEKPSSGEIVINGKNLHTSNNNSIKGMIGYVAQDDILFEELSVYENLYYNAKLCFKDLPEIELEKRVLTVLKDLGLGEIKEIKVGNVLNKKISGGQRKRLNIALELIREPAILFLDEPTSGLSSRDSENVMDLLKELTLKGKLIFVVIHQPSSDIYKMFDKVIILDVGGYQIYSGNPIEAVVYFKKQTNQLNSEQGQCSSCGNVNPEQIFNAIESKVVDEYGNHTDVRKVSPKMWGGYFEKNIIIEKLADIKDAVEKKLELPSIFQQLKVFITRDLLSKFSNTQYLAINLLEAPLLAIVLATIIRYIEDPANGKYHYGENENIPAYLFMSIIVALFMGLTVSAEEIIKDAKIRKRETFLQLSKFSYLNSKIIILFSLSAIQTLSFVLVGNSILGIQGMTFHYWLILFSSSCVANVIGLNVSATFNSAVTIYILIPILLIPQMILSGAIFSFDKLNKVITTNDKVPLIADVMASRWAYEALAVSQFKNNSFEKPFFDLDQKEADANYKHVYWAPYLLKDIESVQEHILRKDPGYEKIVKKKLTLIKNELTKEASINKEIKIDFNDFGKALDRYDYTAIKHIKEEIVEVKEYYSTKFVQVNDQKDQMISKFMISPEREKIFKLTHRNNYNEALADLVKNTNAKTKIVEENGKLIRKVDPVFLIPTENNFFLNYRAHLYAPIKQFAGKRFNTFGFNVTVMWIMCFLLYLMLYFDFLKKILLIFEKITTRIQGVEITFIRKLKLPKLKIKIPFRKKSSDNLEIA